LGGKGGEKRVQLFPSRGVKKKKMVKKEPLACKTMEEGAGREEKKKKIVNSH